MRRSRGQNTFFHEPAQGRMAPWRSVLVGSGMIRSSVKVSTLPNPRQVGQAPIGLLKENSTGSGGGLGAPQFEHSQRSLRFSTSRSPRRSSGRAPPPPNPPPQEATARRRR